MTEKRTIVPAPKGFAVVRDETNFEGLNVIEYTFEVTTKLKVAVSAEADTDEYVRQLTIEYGIKDLARGAIEQMKAVL